MNQSKFSLADVLTVLAALIFGFICYMGANFLNIAHEKVWGMPHTMGCIIMALFCSLLLFATAYGAKLLKRTSRNFKSNFFGEVTLLTLFVLFAIFFATKSSPFTHYFTVTAQKSSINSKLKTSITQAVNMFTEYEKYAENRVNLFRNKLRSVVAAKNIKPSDYTAYGFQNNSVSDIRQIDTKMFTVHADLFPSNYSDTIAKNGIKEVATKWLNHAQTTTSSWKPIGIVGVVNDIENNSNEWLGMLVGFSKSRQQGEQASDFDYPLSFVDVKTNFTKLDKPSGLAIGLAILTYAIMILPWFVTKRSTRFPGLKYLFGLGKSSDNEL